MHTLRLDNKIYLFVYYIFIVYVYTFGGKLYLQKSGGPTGKRVTCPAARIVINRWYRGVKKILLQLNLDVAMVFVYVDDFRIGLEPISFGWTYSHHNHKWIFCEELATSESVSMTPEESYK